MKKRCNKLYAEFEKEIAGSQYQRTRIMMGTFTLGLVITVVNFFLLDNKTLQYYGGADNYLMVVCWVASFIAYEFYVGTLIKKYMHDKKRIGSAFKMTHLLIEVTLVSLLVFYMIAVEKMEIFLDSPLNLLYYLFLILSVLHLELKASLVTGISAALEFSFITYYAFHLSGNNVSLIANSPENSYYLDGVVLIVSGIAAGYVTAQLKKKITLALEMKQARNRMEALFSQQVSQEVAHVLFEDKVGLEKHEATVLAMDIRDFTNFAEHHSPDEIMDFQNRIFGPILDIIGRHGGVVNQIMGDGLMATFGTLVPNLQHAEMAFEAALQIREQVKALSLQGVIPPTRIGLGIHSGDVVTGNIGNDNRKQFSISGSAVIIAFRVEQLNKELGSELLLTGEVNRRLSGSVPNLSYMGLKPIKGFEYEVDVYRAA